jgi:ribokinase
MQSENTTHGAVVVLASFMMDLVARAPRRPRAGESVFGTDFGMFVGGKGCNQAIAAARLGAGVRVIGRLGEDLFAPFFLAALAREGIDAAWVARDAEAGTGVAMPLIEPSGQNSIVAIPRANWRVTEDQIAAATPAFAGAAAFLTGFEIAMPAVLAALRLARESGVRTLLNPAPAPDPVPALDDPLWRLVDVLLPNESEAESLSGVPVRDLVGAERAARVLIDAGCGSVVITLGSRGALWLPGAGAEAVHIDTFPVQQIDATAAGDAFCGALGASLAAGIAMPRALRHATAAGALAVTRLGAEPSLPRRAEVEALLATA